MVYMKMVNKKLQELPFFKYLIIKIFCSDILVRNVIFTIFQFSCRLLKKQVTFIDMCILPIILGSNFVISFSRANEL